MLLTQRGISRVIVIYVALARRSLPSQRARISEDWREIMPCARPPGRSTVPRVPDIDS